MRVVLGFKASVENQQLISGNLIEVRSKGRATTIAAI